MMMELAAAPWQMWVTLAIIAGAVTFYAVERHPLEMVSLTVLIALMVLFEAAPLPASDLGPGLSAIDLLHGFANPALFTILALLVIGQGLYLSGALEGPTYSLLQIHKRRPRVTEFALLSLAFGISAFMNNTPVVVMFIPIVAAMAAERNVAASRLMIPLSFICILGGMTTLIGSSTNLLVADSYRQLSGQEIRFFDFTGPALALAAIGVFYIVVLSRGLLPDRTPPEAAQIAQRAGKQFIAQIGVTPGHPLIGARAVAGMFPDLPEVTVRAVIRHDRTMLPPFDDFEFQPGDVIIIAATRSTLTKFVKSKPDFLAGMIFRDGRAPDEGAPAVPSGELKLIEAVIAPGSRMIGRTVEQVGFFHQTGCVLMGVQRRSRMIRIKMNDIRIEAGDVFLVLGARDDIKGLRTSRDLLPLEWSMTDVPDFRAVMASRAIFAAVIIAIATTPLEPVIPTMIGAIAMIAAGGLNFRQATRALDLRIFLLIAAALAMGLALERTGGAAFLAHWLVVVVEPYGETALLSALFLVTAIITNILTNNATAVLLTPIAYSAALQLGFNPLPFIFTVIYGANCSFATPMAYQTNLLVMGPGHYKFRDFLIFGGPLVILLWLGYTAFAPQIFRAMGLL